MMFTRAIVRPPAANFVEALTTQQLGAPDYQRTLEQHAAYCEALTACGLELTCLQADEHFPDATFVEDTAVIINPLGQAAHKPGPPPGRALLTRPGASSRAGEVTGIANALSQFFPKLASIFAPGTLDGGDVCEAGKHFFIGISARTNRAGAQQLAAWLTTHGYTASCIDIRGIPNLLHLKSGLTYLGDQRLVVIDSLANQADFSGYKLVRVSAREEYAANCVRVNDRVLVAAGYPVFSQTLRDLGYETLALEMTEFAKMDGGLSCLSLRF
jgi:dimethylargininase